MLHFTDNLLFNGSVLIFTRTSRMKKLLSLSLLFSSVWCSAQQFGGFPTRTKWKQINTDTARIIFNPKAERDAQRISSLIHKMADSVRPLGDVLNKINVILHNNTTLANGYVQLAPFRSEYYLVPGGNIFNFGNLPWSEQLAIHEYRHVQQYNNFNRGLSKGLGFVLGQEGRALANALAIPDWFFEGDAVYAETILTPQGRGRMPYFMNSYKSLWREGKEYSWMKLRNGSYKDFVPNHYDLGYLLVNYGNMKYGNSFWKDVTADAATFKGLIYPFQKAIKTHAGVDYKIFRKQAFEYYKHQVSKRRDDLPSPETVTNYYFPQYIGKDSLLYLKNSYKTLPAFYIRDQNGEHKINLQHITSEDWFSYRNGVIAYTSLATHARWSLIDYSNIILLDIKSGLEAKITDKAKYFTPDIAPSGSKVIAVSINDSLQSELHLMDLKGTVIKTFQSPEQSLWVHPRFIDDRYIIVNVRWQNSLMSMERFDTETGTTDQLIPPSAATIGFPTIHHGTVYFVSSSSGNDDIYALRIRDKKLYQLTAGQTGHYYPSVLDDKIVYSKFTTNGLRMMEQSLKSMTSSEISIQNILKQERPLPVAGDTAAYNLLETVTTNRPVSNYKKSTGLFNFHSWRPYYEDPEFSFSLYSDNVLNTFSNRLYYRYNQNEEASAIGWNTTWGGWFAMINAGVDHIFKRELKNEQGTIINDQTELYAGYTLPLQFISGKTVKRLSFGHNLIYNTSPTSVFEKDSVIKSNAYFLQHFLNFSQQLPRARMHIFPRFGYAVTLQYRNRLDEDGYQGIGVANLYLPGAFPTHSIVMSGSFQQTDTNNIFLPNRFPNARGYLDYYFSRMWKVAGNYHFPLFYPDRGIANLVYFMRVRPNLFYAFSRVYSNDKQAYLNLRSVGTELFFDTRWWNQLPVSFGFRYSYLLDSDVTRTNKHVFEFIVPVGLIPD